MPCFGGEIEYPSHIGRGEGQHIEQMALIGTSVPDRIIDNRIASNGYFNRMGRDLDPTVLVRSHHEILALLVSAEPHQLLPTSSDTVLGRTAHLRTYARQPSKRHPGRISSVVPDLSRPFPNEPRLPVLLF